MTRTERNAYQRKWHAARSEEKILADGEKRRANARAKYAENRQKELARHKAAKDRDGAWVRLRARLAEHGLTLDQYAAKDDAQDWVCAICREEKSLDIDHCHTSEQRRGLLCGDCNRGIGLLRENVERFSAAAAYVNKWN